jgi:hypothetical protein
MENELYFHDGNVVSINFGGFDKISDIEIVLQLKIAGTSNRQTYSLQTTEVNRFSLIGDFSEIVKNHWAGSIEDGQIVDMKTEQRLTIRLTGGYIEIFGKIKVSKL